MNAKSPPQTYKLLAGPFYLPADKKSLGASIAPLVKNNRRFELRDARGNKAHAKSRAVFIWAADLKRGRTPEELGAITPAALKTHPLQRVNWNAVDWSQDNLPLSRHLRCSPKTVSRQRRQYAPQTINPNRVKPRP